MYFVQHGDSATKFLDWATRWSSTTSTPIFSYIAVRSGDGVALVRDTLTLNKSESKIDVPETYECEGIIAGYFKVEGGTDALRTFCEQLLTGVL